MWLTRRAESMRIYLLQECFRELGFTGVVRPSQGTVIKEPIGKRIGSSEFTPQGGYLLGHFLQSVCLRRGVETIQLWAAVLFKKTVSPTRQFLKAGNQERKEITLNICKPLLLG